MEFFFKSRILKKKIQFFSLRQNGKLVKESENSTLLKNLIFKNCMPKEIFRQILTKTKWYDLFRKTVIFKGTVKEK